MTLPTGLSTFTLEEHRFFHEEMGRIIGLGLPQTIPEDSLGHLSHHQTIYQQRTGETLTLLEGQGGHVAFHMDEVDGDHAFVNGLPDPDLSYGSYETAYGG